MSNRNNSIHEVVVISGKGGTGKTSLTASFAALAQNAAVLADCDVDAADLHLILTPETVRREPFVSGHQAVIQTDKCTGCGLCDELCRFHAVKRLATTDGRERYRVELLSCEGCGVCVRFCPEQAIAFPDNTCGAWMVSKTRFGFMVHARLRAAAENSGRLVALVRREARELALQQGKSMLITDGPPGIGCPVIASLTGASQALIVTEPSVSGEHDLARVLQLTRHFELPVMVCINKWDINPAMTERIESKAAALGATLAGRIRYDPALTKAQLRAKAVVEFDGASRAAADIRDVWEQVCVEMKKGRNS